MQLGSVGVTSNYAENDQYKVNKVGGEQDFGLNLPVFGGGKLNTGYKLCRSIDGTTPSARTYSLGYQHAIGAAFNVSLTWVFHAVSSGCHLSITGEELQRPDERRPEVLSLQKLSGG